MALLKLAPDSQSQFRRIPETGMSFHFVKAIYRAQAHSFGRADFLVLGSLFAVPFKPLGNLMTAAELIEKPKLEELSKDVGIEGSLTVTDDFSDDPMRARTELINAIGSTFGTRAQHPRPYIPPPGTPLTLKTKTTGVDAFLRFSYRLCREPWP